MMPALEVRDLISFPKGDNTTDTVLGGIHFNRTILGEYGYQLYSNGTLSNGSWCMLTNPPYTPTLLYPNGTFVNSTWCYTPINPIGTRAKIAVGLLVAFGTSLWDREYDMVGTPSW